MNMSGNDSRAGSKGWAAQPDLDDEAVRSATGRGWDEWRDVIDAWPGHEDGHTAIATYLREEHGVDSWWAQGVTVGYERITGLRLPYQEADGSFSISKSRTLAIDGAVLRKDLGDEAGRARLFEGHETEFRSRASAKAPRIGFEEGIALFTIEERDDGKTKLTVTHDKLASPEAAETWQRYWADWLATLGGG